MRKGRRVAIDSGKVNIGLAISDESGVLTFPLVTIKRAPSFGDTCNRIFRELEEYDLLEIYVGYPISMSGKPSSSSMDALGLAHALQEATVIPIRMIDERLSSVSAAASMQSAGKNTKSQRETIDQEAAVIILEHALSTERNLGEQPGKLIEELI
jgi:putative Holliday junction resolvase